MNRAWIREQIVQALVGGTIGALIAMQTASAPEPTPPDRTIELPVVITDDTLFT